MVDSLVVKHNYSLLSKGSNPVASIYIYIYFSKKKKACRVKIGNQRYDGASRRLNLS